jgi:hypothetical protein
MTFGARLKECKTATVVTIYVCGHGDEQISIHAYEMRSSKLHQCTVEPDTFGVNTVTEVKQLPADKLKCMVIQRLHISEDASNEKVLAMRLNPALQTIAMDSPQKAVTATKAVPLAPATDVPTPTPLTEKNSFEVKAKKAISAARTKAQTFISRMGSKTAGSKSSEQPSGSKKIAALKRWDSMSKMLWGDENEPVNRRPMAPHMKSQFNRVNSFIWGESTM